MTRSKRFGAVLCTVLLILTLFSPIAGHADTVQEAQSLMDGIVSYQLQKSGADSVQEWIDGELTANAGVTAEWYILALSQSRNGCNFSGYEAALHTYLDGTNVASATTRQKYALALISTGSRDPYISETLQDSIGQQGIMSWVYGLHLLHNGYTCDAYSTQEIVDKLLSLQLSDGGWALSGAVSDVDVTAMTLQALAPYYGAHASAIDRAVALLSDRQLPDGDFASYGTPNPESTAQVITALSALGIDPMADTRFHKNGNTLLDGLARYRLSDGSFSHTLGGTSNHNATVQAFYSLIAYTRQQNGWGSFYLLDNRKPADAPVSPPVQTEPPAVPTDAPTAPAVQETQAASETETAQTSTETDASETTQASASETSTMAAADTEAAAVSTTASTAALTKTTETETPSETDSEPTEPQKAISYKLWVSLGIGGAGGIVCVILFILKKRHPKNFIVTAIVTAAGIAVVCLTDLQRAEEYYGSSTDKANAIGTVTLTIRCDTIASEGDAPHIPADGVILDVTEFPIAEGDTVFDLLTEAAQAHSIQMEYSGSPEMAYVSGIGYLYEFDYGDLSGWVYHVNGESPSVGCGEYVLEDGDRIEWHYTLDLGNDIR